MATPLPTLLTVASFELPLAILSSINIDVVVVVVFVVVVVVDDDVIVIVFVFVFARAVGGGLGAILQTHIVLAIWEKFLVAKRG